MRSWFANLVERHHASGVLVDANILLLYCVGRYQPDFVSRFKRTRQFTVADFNVLSRIWKEFQIIHTTPTILAEVSNLCGHLPDGKRSPLLDMLGNSISVLNEDYVPSRSLSAGESFGRFGLTDAAILHVARRNILILTDDLPLAQFIQSEGMDVINFNHLRIFS